MGRGPVDIYCGEMTKCQCGHGCNGHGIVCLCNGNSRSLKGVMDHEFSRHGYRVDESWRSVDTLVDRPMGRGQERVPDGRIIYHCL